MDTLSFSLKGYPLRKARKVLNRRKIPGWLWRGNGAITGLVASLVLLVHFPGIERTMSPQTHLVAIFAAYVLLLVSNFMMMRKISGIANASPIFSGNLTVRLTETDLVLTSDEECLMRKWSAITDVVTNSDGLVILSKGFSFIPIPTAAFTDIAEMNGFAAAIRAHINSAKEPQ